MFSFFISPHQYILELCRNEQQVDHDLISSHLKKIKSCPLVLVRISNLDSLSRKSHMEHYECIKY